VVGANCTIEVGGRRVRGRVYPWGVVEGMPSAVYLGTECLLFTIDIFSFCIKIFIGRKLQPSSND